MSRRRGVHQGGLGRDRSLPRAPPKDGDETLYRYCVESKKSLQVRYVQSSDIESGEQKRIIYIGLMLNSSLR